MAVAVETVEEAVEKGQSHVNHGVVAAAAAVAEGVEEKEEQQGHQEDHQLECSCGSHLFVFSSLLW